MHGHMTVCPFGKQVFTNDTLIFNPGETSKPITIPIVCDAVDETTETVNLTLSNPTNATLGSPLSATLEISDSCGGAQSVQFGSASYAVDESAGSALITAYLSAPSGITVTIDFHAGNGTASPGDDYTGVSGSLVFLPGQTAQTFSVPINDDLIYEPTESAILWLSNPVNAVLGPPYIATLYIFNDDDPVAFVFIPYLVQK